MIPEWPIRAEGLRRRPTNLHALGRGGDSARRLADAAIDLGLPIEGRVTDRVRASVSTMRRNLVGDIERALRLMLARGFADDAGLAASLSSVSVGIAVPLLADAGRFSHPPLVAILLRRAEEFVLARRLCSEPGGAGLPVGDPDADIAAAATELSACQARRLDRFGECALLPDDLPAELAVWLVWQVAAALRHYLCVHHRLEEDRVDALLNAAATMLLAEHDEGRGLRAIAARLAARLAAGSRADGPLLEALLEGGQVAALTAVLATTVSVPGDDIWNIVADPAGGRLATVLRAAGISRAAAAGVLLRLTPPTADAVAEVAMFDSCDIKAADAALNWLRSPVDYRDAVRSLDVALALAEAGT